jgi:chorismate-pyruvate lyase
MLDATAIRPASAGLLWHGSWLPHAASDVARVARLQAPQRMLLTTDGTVTTALAALAGEPVGVRVLAQDLVSLHADDAQLALWAGGRILDRRVLVHGAGSGAPLLYGASRIVVHRLPREARDALADGSEPIGLVLAAHEIETFRVPLGVGLAPATDDAAAHLGPGLMCRRTYAIRARGKTVMVVDEQFPAAGFGAHG